MSYRRVKEASDLRIHVARLDLHPSEDIVPLRAAVPADTLEIEVWNLLFGVRARLRR